MLEKRIHPMKRFQKTEQDRLREEKLARIAEEDQERKFKTIREKLYSYVKRHMKNLSEK